MLSKALLCVDGWVATPVGASPLGRPSIPCAPLCVYSALGFVARDGEDKIQLLALRFSNGRDAQL